MEEKLKSDPNSPLGRMDRTPTPGKPIVTDETDTDQQWVGADPFAPFPDRCNPKTGESGGPTGPEPTRYGDWERKGRVTDF
ncbi:unnamed protein product [Medioppia subpectinata]|uniref:Succinate dehydrogenase assembly factor 4, mitochondrial n=1 Tax=Medioppia subpectinata TaxID=1979941 RepID=A0A7R9KGL3_9ACAR|nr:unnamed protein product [Medioppia subpectinata]CAG2101965.1 unnamed protein product [Medioppia subpectinata]